MRKRLKYIFSSVVFVLVIGSIATATYLNRPKRSEQGLVTFVESQQKPVEAVTLVPQDLTESLLATGILKADQDVTLLAEVPGQVKKVFKELGDPCKKGELAVRLDSETYQIARQQAQALVDQSRVARDHAKKDLARFERLVQQAVATEQQMDAAQMTLLTAAATLEQARAGLRAAKRNLRETEIRCPFGGFIAEKSVQLGQMIGPQSALVRLVSTDVLRLSVTVPASQLVHISKEQKVHITDPTMPGHRQLGTVARIGIAADERTHSFPVEVELPGADSLFKAGQVVSARFDLREHPGVLAVPRAAVFGQRESFFVWRVADGRAQQTEITRGAEIEGQVVILSGPRAGDAVVVVGGEGLRDGDEVDVAPSEPSQR